MRGLNTIRDNMSTKNKQIDYFGIDTETYIHGGEGLLSIQIHGKNTVKYIGLNHEIINFDDEDIRYILLDEFHYFLDDLRNDSVFYFFNLRFDFSQMEKYFLEHYTLADEWNLKKGQMLILQSPQNVYSVRLRNKTTGRMVYFTDLFHLLNTSLNRATLEFIGERKIDLETVEFAKKIPNPREIEYAMKDAELTYKLAMALKNVDGFDLTESLTIGARSLKLFREVISAFGSTYDLMGHEIPLKGRPEKDIWTYFGITEEDNLEFEEYIRLGVRGGITQAFQTGQFKDCIHLDICSAHPSQMVKDIPYGPMLDDIPGSNYTYMAFPKGSFKLKPQGLKIMTFRSKALCLRYAHPDTAEELEPASFASSFFLDGSFGIWQPEYEQILTQYNFEPMEPTEFKYFSTRKDLRLSALIHELYQGKETARGAKKTVFKYLLNSLYGKFLTRPDGQSVEYYYDSKGRIARKSVVDEGRRTVNLALGSWISMRTRVQLIDACLKVPRDTLLYTDTDSIIFKRYDGWEDDFSLSEKLGDWDLESEPSDVSIIGPKTYQEKINGRVETKCAGLSRRVARTLGYGELKEGLSVKVLKARRNPDTLAIRLVEMPHVVSTKPTPYLGGH